MNPESTDTPSPTGSMTTTATDRPATPPTRTRSIYGRPETRTHPFESTHPPHDPPSRSGYLPARTRFGGVIVDHTTDPTRRRPPEPVGARPHPDPRPRHDSAMVPPRCIGHGHDRGLPTDRRPRDDPAGLRGYVRRSSAPPNTGGTHLSSLPVHRARLRCGAPRRPWPRGRCIPRPVGVPGVQVVSVARSFRTPSPDNTSNECARIPPDRSTSTVSDSSSTNADNHDPTARQ
jgi:hypothetical protein